MSTIRIRGVRFHFFPHDHEPRHTHAEYGESTAIVEFDAAREIRISTRSSAAIARSKWAEVKHILEVATEHLDALIAAWESMHT